MTMNTNNRKLHARRSLLKGAAALPALPALMTLGMPIANAQSLPSTVTLSVGFPVGGSGDIFARILAEALREELNRAVIVENKPGGGGMTVGTALLRQPKDGSQIMLATGSTAIAAPVSRAEPPYDPVTDFQWIAYLSNAPFVIAVNPKLPVTDLKSLIAHVQENQGKYFYGHAGLGTTVHLAAELFKELTGLQIQDVPYAGSGPAIVGTISGDVQFIVETSGTLKPHHDAGRMRIVASFGEERDSLLPDVRTAREDGIDIVAGTSNLLAAPLGTPKPILEELAQAINNVMKRPDMQERLITMGIKPITDSNPAIAQEYVTQEVNRWGPVAKNLGIAL